MKILVLILVSIISINVFSNEEVTKLKNDLKKTLSRYPELLHSELRYFDGQDLSYGSLSTFQKTSESRGKIDKPEDWVKGKRMAYKAVGCSNYIMNNVPDHIKKKVISTRMKFTELRGYNNKQREDIQVMMNRDLRTKIQKGINNVASEDKHQFCEKKLSFDQITKIRDVLKTKKKNEIRNYKKPDLSGYHPRDQKVLERLLKDGRKKGKRGRDLDNYAFKYFITKYYPMIDSKANLEILPHVKKTCPGVLERFWDICRKEKIYQNMFKSAMKAYCLMDNEDRIDKKCFL